MGHESHHRPEHGHGHHPKTQLDRIEEAVGLIEGSAGRTEQRVMDALERLSQMPVKPEVQEALDALNAKVTTAVNKEIGEQVNAVLVAVTAARDESAATIAELNTKIDELIAGGNSSDEVAAIQALGDTAAAQIDAIVPNVVSPPPTDPVVAARRR